jgi:preprotein translocase subunit SecA
VANAGRKGTVTIATNMAGRGTDIILGGNPEQILADMLKKKGYNPNTAPEPVYEEVIKEAQEIAIKEHEEVISLGGLHILGTERHEARRIDNQLRGRSGRQGDPGSSRFYISLEDDLMKILGSDRIKGLLVRAGMRDGVPIENRLVSRAIENAQKQIEGQNFSIRKHLLEYDDVMNKQRQYIYTLRRNMLGGKNIKEDIAQLTEDVFTFIFETHVDEDKEPENWDYDGLYKGILAQFGIDIKEVIKEDYREIPVLELKETLLDHIKAVYQEKEQQFGPEHLRELERTIMLQQIDSQWKDHLLNIDHLKEGIGLRGYAQKDPLIEYKKESYNLFQAMQDRIEEEALRFLFLIQPIPEDDMESWKQKRELKMTKPSSKLPGKKKKKKKEKKKKIGRIKR